MSSDSAASSDSNSSDSDDGSSSSDNDEDETQSDEDVKPILNQAARSTPIPTATPASNAAPIAPPKPTQVLRELNLKAQEYDAQRGMMIFDAFAGPAPR